MPESSLKNSNQSATRPRSGWGLIRLFTPFLVIVIIGFIVAYQFMGRPLPDKLVMAAGSREGVYFSFAERYREYFRDHGIELEILESAGTVQNFDYLESNKAHVAFAQGGVGSPQAYPGLLGLASLYFEPLWIFHNKNRVGGSIQGTLNEFRNKRLAIGPEGSGTRSLALQLLTDNRLEEQVKLLPLSGVAAADALLDGRADAAFFVISPRSGIIEKLLEQPGIGLMNVVRAQAYTRIHPFLSRLTLPEGMMDFEKNIPDRTIQMLAPATTLVARDDIHPALVSLLLQAASHIHGGSGLFERPGQFPSARYLDFPLSSDARRYFQYGPPFLQRYVSFRLANQLDRLKIMILPFLTLLIPLFKMFPPLYQWSIRKKVYRWYRELGVVDRLLFEPDGEHSYRDIMDDLERIEAEVRRVKVPDSYADELYNLRLHIGYIKELCRQKSMDG